MNDIFSAIIATSQAMSVLEVVAVILAVAYLVLAIRQSNMCWYAGFASTAIFSWLFWNVSLIMESALNLYYLVIAVYGWWAWRRGNQQNTEGLPIQQWSIKQHITAWGLIIVLTLISGSVLTRNTDAALPYLDSLTTWGAVITTWMVTRKVLENWLYWQVFNTGAIILYVDRELYLTALLMAIYLLLAVVGWFKWRQDFLNQNTPVVQPV